MFVFYSIAAKVFTFFFRVDSCVHDKSKTRAGLDAMLSRLLFRFM